ncbi:hypothetical protein [Schlesneria sp.]|uniref:hypothetical protein n=1 Tax=Schlesneria sp. TaxID=2762018 RepID=UPI003F821755
MERISCPPPATIFSTTLFLREGKMGLGMHFHSTMKVVMRQRLLWNETVDIE